MQIPLTAANELEIAILNLFIEIRVRYPNMVIGRLARDNVKKAMDNGITASQVGADVFVADIRSSAI